MFSNDYVSELKLSFISIWTRTRACCTPSCRYTRCQRCSCWSGSRDYVSFNFNHRDGNCLPPRGVTCVDLNKFSLNLNWSLPSLFLQLKTGVKSTLTSQIKELGTINTFCIKNWINMNLDWSTMTMKNI
jgi:hypothetical protein